jgi:hypothetical protein
LKRVIREKRGILVVGVVVVRRFCCFILIELFHTCNRCGNHIFRAFSQMDEVVKHFGEQELET